jgi:capsular exopolysaccharide synthesis family protein
MSRVADACQKSPGFALAGPAPLDYSGERAREPESWVMTQVPWDFGASPTLPSEDPIAEVTKPLEIVAVGRRSLANSTSVCPEELTLLTQRIFQPGVAGRRIRSVLFTAVGPESGSATLSAAAAEALARQTTASVCLVDGNLRSPSLHTSFGLTSRRGLSDALLDAPELGSLLTRVASNLWLLSGGSHSSDAVPSLTAERIGPLLVELLTSFDYLLVDTSPAGMHSDATLLGPLVDGIVLVVDADATRREAARRAVENLRAMKAPILGAVLTNRTLPIPEAIYRRL